MDIVTLNALSYPKLKECLTLLNPYSPNLLAIELPHHVTLIKHATQ